MTIRREMFRLRAVLTASAIWLGLTALMLSGGFGSVTLARMHTASPSSLHTVTECEGTACSQVSVLFDEAKQFYHAQNNSSDHWARVTASNMAATATACLGPGKEAYLQLKSIDGPYRADFADARCGEQGPEGTPPVTGE